MSKNILGIGIECLFLVSVITPMTVGYNIRISNEKDIQSTLSSDGPMDSAWPMYCHDTRHTCHSQYNSSNNLGTEKWRYKIPSGYGGDTAPVIDNNGNIYFGAVSDEIYSLSSNGSLNWRVEIWGYCSASLVIDKNGIIYVPTSNSHPSYFYAFDLNGSKLWEYRPESENPDSSPAIAEDGTIYFGDDNGWLYAMNPNGTLKWRYKTDGYIHSSPAIDENGIIYFVTGHESEGYLYALYPNGTLKWKKDEAIRDTEVCIDDEGIIYYLSFNDLCAINSDGSLKWKTPVNYGTTPSINNDGVVYIGYYHDTGSLVDDKTLKAFNSENGDLLWSFNPGNKQYLYISTPAISADGILYFVTTIGDYWNYDGGEIIALNPDGTERWREYLTDNWVESIPSIDEDGTVYVISIGSDYCSYLHAFGELDPDAPSAPTITGKNNGTIKNDYEYKFKSTSPLGKDIFYNVDWGDGNTKDWFGPYESGEEVTASHKWSEQGTYTIRARAKDTENLWGPWGKLTVKMPKYKIVNFNSLLLNLLGKFPLLERLLLMLQV